MKVYAVRKGRATGLFASWPECEAQVKGFPGAEFKSFRSEAEAAAWLGETDTKPAAAEPDVSSPTPPYAFTDGSYNKDKKLSAYGGFLVTDHGSEIVLKGKTVDPEWTEMRNVAGEVMGAMEAVRRAMAMGLERLTIFYDYTGVEAWATGYWKANKPATREYRDFMRRAAEKLDIRFVKVSAHTGIPGNERADALAKSAAGL